MGIFIVLFIQKELYKTNHVRNARGNHRRLYINVNKFLNSLLICVNFSNISVRPSTRTLCTDGSLTVKE